MPRPPARSAHAVLRVAAVATLDAGALAIWRSSPGRAWAGLSRGVRAPAADHLAADVAGAGLFLVALWVAVALTAAVLAAAPGLTGRAARAVARRLVPAALRRAVAGATGLGILLTPVAASATTAHPTPPPSAASSAAASPAGVPDPPASRTIPAPTWPTDGPAAPRHTHPAAPHRTHPAAPHPAPAHPHVAGDRVTVRPGDSLWLITAHRLGPGSDDARIAASWPELYRANRDVIGDDPSLIRPGQHLELPGAEHLGGSTADGTKEIRR